ncbi:MAG: IS630 family transposase [Proteobacteria bacterium]|nr:IS630 family transposase [Pseudomonadota bacterium]
MPYKPTVLSEEDRAKLERMIRSPTTSQGLAQRARIILSLADGSTVEQVANEQGTSKARVYRWRLRYLDNGLDGLGDTPRTGRPRTLAPDKVQKILTATVERIPHEATHWSLRLMAKYAGVSKWQVQQVWQAADLKPHRIKNFKISNDPQFADKVIDVVGLYMNPPDNAMVLSVDEKTQIQALDRTQPMLPLRPGQIERRTHDYKRNGTTNLYAAFDVLTGQVMGRLTQRHRAVEFLSFLRQIERDTPKKLDLHLILDNSSTHKTKEVKAWLEKRPRFVMHFTPTSASWLNAVENWFSQLERRSIHRGVFISVKDLKEEIHRFIRAHNKRNAKPFVWTKSAESIIQKVARAKQSLGNET